MASLLPTLRRKQTQDEQPLARLRDDFDSLFDRLLGRWAGPFETEFGLDPLWDVDVDERGNEIVVRAETPGFEPDEIDVEITGRMLTIKAEKKEEKKEEKGNGAVEQQSYSAFVRSVTLPEGIQRDKIKANYRNGVLEVHIPKSDEAQPRRISVQS